MLANGVCYKIFAGECYASNTECSVIVFVTGLHCTQQTFCLRVSKEYLLRYYLSSCIYFCLYSSDRFLLNVTIVYCHTGDNKITVDSF